MQEPHRLKNGTIFTVERAVPGESTRTIWVIANYDRKYRPTTPTYILIQLQQALAKTYTFVAPYNRKWRAAGELDAIFQPDTQGRPQRRLYEVTSPQYMRYEIVGEIADDAIFRRNVYNLLKAGKR